MRKEGARKYAGLNPQANSYGRRSPSLGDSVSVSWPRGEGLEGKVGRHAGWDPDTPAHRRLLVTAVLYAALCRAACARQARGTQGVLDA